MALPKNHGGDIFTTVVAVRTGAPRSTPMGSGWVQTETHLKIILWILRVVNLDTCGCLAGGM
jgi:hypothetical protein